MHDRKQASAQPVRCTKDNEAAKTKAQDEHKDEIVPAPKSSAAPPQHDKVTLTKVPTGAPSNYCNRRSWISTERMNELRRHAQEAVKQNKTFAIRGCFNSVRNALLARGWVEKLDVHRKHILTGVCQVTYDELAQTLPKRKAGETRRQYVLKCERNIISRFLEHLPIDFLWTNRKEKCDYIDQARNPGMLINKFHRAPFTSKEGLCTQLKDFHWFYEEGTAEMYFPRCFNVWSPEELLEFVDNFKLTACIAFLHAMVDNYRLSGFDAVFSPTGKIPFSNIDFAYKRCSEFLDSCQHNDIDVEETSRVWEHEWDNFLHQQQYMVNEGGKILADTQRLIENLIRNSTQLLERLKVHWPQYTLDGYQNLWIVKPANKCRGRGIQLMDNLKKILNLVNPSIATKSRFVVQKYIERPLIIHQTKFDIRQWFLVTNVQPLVVWMYKESYLRFSSQEYSLSNHHESVHLTNYAIQKKYTNAKRDKRLPTENMWDCYTFQAYLRQHGKQEMWLDRIYPGMRKAIIGTMLSSQENMDRRPNTYELFGADFMICEDFYPWLIEINSSPDLGATTSVTARMCPQCLEDVVKVIVDRRLDPRVDTGNFELIYRQVVPPTPAYMGLNLCVRGKQIVSRVTPNYNYYYQRRERSFSTHAYSRTRSNTHKEMPTFNATEYVEKSLAVEIRHNLSNHADATKLSPRPPTKSLAVNVNAERKKHSPSHRTKDVPPTPAREIKQPIMTYAKRRRSCGARLPDSATNTTAVSAVATDMNSHLKCIVRKCVLQKTGLDASKSESNITELLRDLKTKSLVKPTAPRLCSTLPSRTRTSVCDAKPTSKSLVSLQRLEKAGAETRPVLLGMQAVGKSMPWCKSAMETRRLLNTCRRGKNAGN